MVSACPRQISTKEGKNCPGSSDLRLPLILRPPSSFSADRQTQLAVKEQPDFDTRFRFETDARSVGQKVPATPRSVCGIHVRFEFNAANRWQDGINRGEEARLKGFPLLFHPGFLANGVVVIRTRLSTAFRGRGKCDFLGF